MSHEQADSDPLPYTQIDRAVKPKANLLAGMMKTSPQHALGSLVEFWDLNGDPRDLERLVAQGKREVVLSADVVRCRFRIASGGHDVSPGDLDAIGLLERIGDEYRVRGMSRYFEPIEARLQRRVAAQAGGAARAAAERGPDGRFLPVSGGGPSAGESGGPAASRTPADIQPEASRLASPEPAGGQAKSTSAVSGQRTEALKETLSSKLDGEPPPATFLVVFEHWRRVMGHKDAKAIGKRRRAVAARLAEGYTVEQLKRAIDGCAATPHNIGETNGKRYDDLELICRDGTQVERFIRNAAAARKTIDVTTSTKDPYAMEAV